MYTIHDNGQHDPIEFVLSDTDQAIARIIRTEIRVHRDTLNRAANDDHGPYTPAPAVAQQVMA